MLGRQYGSCYKNNTALSITNKCFEIVDGCYVQIGRGDYRPNFPHFLNNFCFAYCTP
jgi:hypothetical protein